MGLPGPLRPAVEHQRGGPADGGGRGHDRPVEVVDAALVLYSGAERTWQAHRDTLASLGGSADWLGADPGRAAAHDVALLDVFWTAMHGVAHAFALARAEGIAAGALAPYAKGIAGLLPDLVDDLARRLDVDDHTADVSNIASSAASTTCAMPAAEAHGIDSGPLRAAGAVADRAIRAGHGGDDFSRLTRVYAAGA
jgi:3-hydroxyisobutyrate dehydrogenase-like beta-hydroxyacid dehydrogenase